MPRVTLRHYAAAVGVLILVAMWYSMLSSSFTSPVSHEPTHVSERPVSRQTSAPLEDTPQPAVHVPASKSTDLDSYLRDKDPSFNVRCTHGPVSMTSRNEVCLPANFKSSPWQDVKGGVAYNSVSKGSGGASAMGVLPLEGPVLQPGAVTTKGMHVEEMTTIVDRAGQGTTSFLVRDSVTKKLAHHPIFHTFAQHTYNDVFLDKRVVEFNGVHTHYDYDCEANIDFRQYHQVRAAMCLEYEDRAKGSTTPKQQGGMFPVVDEEYFEYVMTMTTALDAAKEGKGYTFIELGARYGTWIVRAGTAYRHMLRHMDAKTVSNAVTGDLKLSLLAVEGNCYWFRKMEEHVACNFLQSGDEQPAILENSGAGKLTVDSKLLLSYAAPRSYNKVNIADETSFKQPRAVSLLDMLPRYEFIDMMDFDIQGFEAFTVQEPGAMELMAERVGFVHFGTHSTDIERQLLAGFQAHGFVVTYFFAGAHTKKLNHAHVCLTPFGPSRFNDGVLGFANLKYYPQLKNAPKVRGNKRAVSKTCHFIPEALEVMFKQSSK